MLLKHDVSVCFLGWIVGELLGVVIILTIDYLLQFLTKVSCGCIWDIFLSNLYC